MTTINLQPASEKQSFGASEAFSQAHHHTTEFLLASVAGRFADFCRLQCGLCRAFVSQLKPPTEFAALAPFFPFIRLASVLEIPRTQANLAAWLQIAFQAGHKLGQTHPEAVEEILPDHVLRKAHCGLTLLRDLVSETGPASSELPAAFTRLVERQWPQVNPAEMDQVYCEAALRALRAGFMAATVARFDPCLGDFCEDLPLESAGGKDLVCSALVAACVDEWNLPLAGRMEHPLLRIARQLHPHDSSAQAGLLTRLGAVLRAEDVRSENEDPASLLDHVSSQGDSEAGDADSSFRGRQLESMVRRQDLPEA